MDGFHPARPLLVAMGQPSIYFRQISFSGARYLYDVLRANKFPCVGTTLWSGWLGFFRTDCLIRDAAYFLFREFFASSFFRHFECGVQIKFPFGLVQLSPTLRAD